MALGHEAGSHDVCGVPGKSRITQVEAAHYMGLSNVIMVEINGKPQPPLRQHAIALQSCERVVWSVVGAGGDLIVDHRSPVNEALGLANEFPNVAGAIMDDYFALPDEDGRTFLPRISTQQLKEIRRGLRSGPRPLDLWVVVYDHQFDCVPQDHLDLCDVINFWTWSPAHLADLEANLTALQARVPDKRIVLGCYMWDYRDYSDKGQPIPLDLMEKQCTLGLKWLKTGRIEGIVFLASCICDLDIEAVEWTRRWIASI